MKRRRPPPSARMLAAHLPDPPLHACLLCTAQMRGYVDAAPVSRDVRGLADPRVWPLLPTFAPTRSNSQLFSSTFQPTHFEFVCVPRAQAMADQQYYTAADGQQMEQQPEVAVEATQLEGAQGDLAAMGGHMAMPVAGAEGVEQYTMEQEQMVPQEVVQMQSPWEKKKISDLRAFLITKNLDVGPLDTLLAMAGDPVTRINRAPKGESRKRAAAEGAEGTDGAPEKRRRAPAVPDPNIPPEVQAMSVTELRVRPARARHGVRATRSYATQPLLQTEPCRADNPAGAFPRRLRRRGSRSTTTTRCGGGGRESPPVADKPLPRISLFRVQTGTRAARTRLTPCPSPKQTKSGNLVWLRRKIASGECSGGFVRPAILSPARRDRASDGSSRFVWPLATLSRRAPPGPASRGGEPLASRAPERALSTHACGADAQCRHSLRSDGGAAGCSGQNSGRGYGEPSHGAF